MERVPKCDALNGERKEKKKGGEMGLKREIHTPLLVLILELTSEKKRAMGWETEALPWGPSQCQSQTGQNVSDELQNCTQHCSPTRQHREGGTKSAQGRAASWKMAFCREIHAQPAQQPQGSHAGKAKLPV